MDDLSEQSISLRSFDDLKPLSFTSSSAFDDWERFKKKFNWMIETLPKTTSDARKVGLLMTRAGDEAVDIYDTLGLPEKPSLEEVILAFDKYVQVKTNSVFERSVFYKLQQKTGQTIDAFILELKKQAAKCSFHSKENDNLIRDFLVLGLADTKLQEKLLRDPLLDLEKAVSISKVWERSKKEAQIISQNTHIGESAVDRLNVARGTRQSRALSQAAGAHSSLSSSTSECGSCGYGHSLNSTCPARNKECSYCRKVGHFMKKCRKRLYVQQTRNTSEVLVTETDGLEILHLCAVFHGSQSSSKAWYVPLLLFNQSVEFKVDTGAECNTLHEFDYKKLVPLPKLQPVKVALKPYMSSELIKPLGKITVPYKLDMVIEFYVVPGKFRSDNLLSLETSERLGLIKRTNEVSIVAQNQSLFTGIGKIPGTCSIQLKQDVKPVISRRRRFAQSLLPRVKITLEKMEKLGVIERIKKPTEWVSNILVVEKNNRNKDLRVCLDPKSLNEAIIVPKYSIPKTEELVSQLASKSVFTVLDMSSGFWQMVLDQKSSEYTTFQTPFGRYCFKRLCFGLSSAPELFMEKIAEIFGDIEGCYPYFDDLIIAGKNREEHNHILDQVFSRARQFNVRFNAEKLQYCRSEVRFLGLIITGNGIQVDPQRVAAISNFQVPSDKKAVMRFLGMVKYLSPFIPNVAMHTAHLRELTKSHVEFKWSSAHQLEFQTLKDLLGQTPILRYFNPEIPIIIQTDSSQSGIGSCLLQDSQPVAYASRALTKSERMYSQIEKELLAIVYAVEKFHYFVYGHLVTVHSDHKPLEMILNKPFDKISARLQRLCLRLLKYNIQVKYCPGTRMHIADALSRAYWDEEPNTEYLQEFCVHATEVLVTTDEKRQQLVTATSQDSELQLLVKYLRGSWPKSKNKLSIGLRKFWSIKHLLSLQEGLIFFENRLVVPQSLKSDILQLLHKGHLNVNKVVRRARTALYWIGMQSDIVKFIESCPTCVKYKRNNQKEPLKLLPLTTRPWERVSMDILTVDRRDFLVIYDSYSYWLEVLLLHTKSALEIIKQLQSLFIQFGSPSEIVSDNIPFNCAEYKKFAEKWVFKPTFISPKYSQANGFAEKGVAIAKMIIRKNDDIGEALLQYRTAPIPHIGYSPAQIFFNRNLKTQLPVTEKVLNQSVNHTHIREAQLIARQRLEDYYNCTAGKELPPLQPGDTVMVKKNMSDPTWKEGKVLQTAKTPRSYLVQQSGGPVIRRNRRFLRPVSAPRRFITEL